MGETGKFHLWPATEKRQSLAAEAGGIEELPNSSVSETQIEVLNATKVRTKEPDCYHKLSSRQRTVAVHHCEEHDCRDR